MNCHIEIKLEDQWEHYSCVKIGYELEPYFRLRPESEPPVDLTTPTAYGLKEAVGVWTMSLKEFYSIEREFHNTTKLFDKFLSTFGTMFGISVGTTIDISAIRFIYYE